MKREVACPSFWFTIGGTTREPIKHRARTKTVFMFTCRVCSKPIFKIGRKPRVLCKTKPGTIPGTSCRAIDNARAQKRVQKPFGLLKILKTIQGGEMLADEGVIPPMIRDSY